MKIRLGIVLASFALCFIAVGCERTSEMPGPTVSKFTGKVMAGSKQVTIPDGSKLIVNLTHSSAQSFGIPIKADGTFNIGEMPIGKYSAVAIVEATSQGGKGNSGQPKRVNVKGGFEIKDGQTEYTIDLGEDFKF